MLKEKPRAVLFDWDGTLVNSWPIIHESMNFTLEAMGHEKWTMSETSERAKKSLRDAFPGIFGDRWEEAMDIFYSAYRKVHLERIEKVDGAEELINLFFSKGCHLGVVSNKSGKHLRAECRKLGWESFFSECLIGAADAPRDKPAIDPLLLALTGTNITPNDLVWFIGDTWVDIACGNKANCTTILINEKGPFYEEFEEHPPDEYFHSCNEFLHFASTLWESC
tara:strand:+ start:44 stop:712 length:669 start_codon:yes stop_codon:yes gene_type:complete